MRELCVLALCAIACGPDSRGGLRDGGHGDSDSGGMSLDQGACAGCSSDLHQVLDCSGQVIATCPSGQGCSPTKGCVPACEAAAENRTSIGCEYYAVAPPVLSTGNTCFAAFVANTWGEPITIGVDRAGTTLNVDSFTVLPSGSGQATTYTATSGGLLPPDTVAIVFLSALGGSCPGARAGATNAGYVGTALGDAFRITTSAPVVVYDIYPYGAGTGATTSATLLLPTSAWDTSYVAVTMPQSYPEGPPWVSFVSSADDTHITIKPKVAVVGGSGVAGGPANAPIMYTLPRGRILKLEQAADLSGSAIVADKPIAVFGGNALEQLPAGMIAADCMHQQIPPVRSLGSRYAGVRYRNRLPTLEETPPWTLVGVVAGTTLSFDPPVAGAPTSVGVGDVLRFDAAGPFTVSSQDDMHPFYFAQHMTGCGQIGGYMTPLGCTGNPEWVNVVPPAQYLDRYVFFTDPTYPTTNLVFVRAKNGSAFEDVMLDCAGALSGWKPVGTAGDLEYTTFDLIHGNFAKQGSCDNGRHIAESKGAFGLTVWGWGTNESAPYMSEAVSYAYPAGTSVRLINSASIDVN